MADNFLTTLKKRARGLVRVGTKKASDWFREAVKALSKPSARQLIDQAGPFKRFETLSKNSIGKMYLFQYDPKLKEVLPYYDIYPLIFPIQYYSDGFLGINLHYLPITLRMKLMRELYTIANNKKFDKTTKLQISYSLLNGAARFSYFRPCVKRYLFSHIRSPFLYISPDEWDIVLSLPIQKFKKATAEKVWEDSRRAVQ